MREALREAGQKVANIQTFAAPSIAGSSQKHDTSFGAKAGNADAVASTNDSKAGASGSSQYDLTVVEPVSPKHGSPLASRSRDESSVVTKVRPYQPVAPERQNPNRAFSIVLSVVLFAIVAAVVYTFTRSPSTQTNALPVDAAAPSPTVRVETQNPTAPSQPFAQPPQQASNPSGSSTQSQPAAVDANPQPAAASNPATAQPNPQGTTGAPNSTAPTLTPEEERARKADEIRRERREKDEQDMRRQRQAIEEEQRRERERVYMERERQLRPGQPPPGGGPPPPRRDGPPPPY
jgi:hypothetical protein